MIAMKKLRAWIAKHWHIMINRPTNGHTSLEELNKTLKEIRGNKERVNDIVGRMIVDNKNARKLIDNNAFTNNNSG